MPTQSELSSLLADVVDERAYSTEPSYYDGCAAALEWVTSQRRHGPVSEDRALSPDSVVMASELRRAIAMLHGEEPAGRPSGYLSGVEATLAWVLGRCEDPPL